MPALFRSLWAVSRSVVDGSVPQTQHSNLGTVVNPTEAKLGIGKFLAKLGIPSKARNWLIGIGGLKVVEPTVLMTAGCNAPIRKLVLGSLRRTVGVTVG